MHPDSPAARHLLEAARATSADCETRCRFLVERARSSDKLHAALQRELAHAGLTEAGFLILTTLASRDPAPLLRSDLAPASRLTPMRSDDALTRLEMSHLVERRRDARDRRLVWLQLTPAGRRHATAAVERYLSTALKITAQLADAELADGLNIVAKLHAGAAQLTRGESGVSEVQS